MNTTCYTVLDTPIGELRLLGSAYALERIEFSDFSVAAGCARDDDALAAAREQLGEYFSGKRTAFDLNLEPRGTPFQCRVWSMLQHIPCGSTTTYGQLAHALGNLNKARAVGLANGTNPIPIIIPCHRVLGANGQLTGYGGGLQRKRWLLDFETGLVGSSSV